LVALEVEVVDESKEDSDGVLVSNSRIKLIVVDAFDLGKSSSDPACFVGS